MCIRDRTKTVINVVKSVLKLNSKWMGNIWLLRFQVVRDICPWFTAQNYQSSGGWWISTDSICIQHKVWASRPTLHVSPTSWYSIPQVIICCHRLCVHVCVSFAVFKAVFRSQTKHHLTSSQLTSFQFNWPHFICAVSGIVAGSCAVKWPSSRGYDQPQHTQFRLKLGQLRLGRMRQY